MATNVYVDAFNLYYGSLKGTPYRWLQRVPAPAAVALFAMPWVIANGIKGAR
jgi:hypothetical protein